LPKVFGQFRLIIEAVSTRNLSSDHAFNDISNITLPFKRSNNYDEIEGHKFKFIKCHNITINIQK